MRIALLLLLSLALPAAADGPIGERLWRFQAKGRMSSCQPVMANGKVIVSMHPELYAIDAKTGKQIWRTADGPYWYPAIVGDKCYAASRKPFRVCCFAIDSGKQLWKAEIRGGRVPRYIVSGGLLIIVDEQLRAYDAATGKVRWSVRLAGQTLDPVAIGDRVYALAGKTLSCVAREDGKLLWTKELGAARISLVASEDRLLMTRRTGLQTCELECRDADKGEQRWSIKSNHHWHQLPVVRGQQLYLVGKGAGGGTWIASHDTASGKQRWRSMSKLRLGCPAPRGDVLFCATLNNKLAAFDERTGKLLQELVAACTSTEPVCAADGKLIVRNGGTLECWKAETPGADEWPFVLGGPGGSGLPPQEGGPR